MQMHHGLGCILPSSPVAELIEAPVTSRPGVGEDDPIPALSFAGTCLSESGMSNGSQTDASPCMPAQPTSGDHREQVLLRLF